MARGGFQVDMAWQDGELTELEILSKLGNVLELRFDTSEASLSTYESQVITLEDVLRVL
jgi:alpha-L-fucosidase 2